jgi:putative ABC transport system permease protein
MRLGDILLSALRGVTSNKLRSILTLLGVLIGVASVILLMAVGNGSAAKIRAAITSLGTNTITVRANGGQSSGSDAITLAVSKQLADAGLGHVSAVVPQATTSLTVSSTAQSETDISIIGTSANYFDVSTAKVASGAAFTADDVDGAAKVAVIGSTLASELFTTGSALGQSISIDGTPFTIVGILGVQSSVGFEDPNSEVIAPITRVQRSFTGFGAVSSLLVQAKNADAVTAAEGEVGVELNQLLGVSATATAPYTVTDQSSLLQTQAESADSFTALLAAVAAISLLVGGIGVTNVMLVTVTERTREIGIRKALGATRGAILGQFLAEAATLTLLGGVLGVVIALIAAQYPFNGTQPVVIGYSIPLALGVSVAIGVFFGVYPAGRAAAMRPIQALRSI